MDDVTEAFSRLPKDLSGPTESIFTGVGIVPIVPLAVGSLFAYSDFEGFDSTAKILKCGGAPPAPPGTNPYGKPIVLDDQFVYTVKGGLLRLPQ